MVEWLLAHGADPEATDYEGKTALQRAIENGNESVAAALQSRGA
jgi:ankyrin repeat protein